MMRCFVGARLLPANEIAYNYQCDGFNGSVESLNYSEFEAAPLPSLPSQLVSFFLFH
jgi:hypothetical protein